MEQPAHELPASSTDDPVLELAQAPEQLDEPDAEEEDDEDAAASKDQVQTQDPLKLYVRAIGDGRLLTPAEERELARRKDLGDEAAKRRLIECNLRLVMSITRTT